MAESKNPSGQRRLAQSSEDVRFLNQMCREGRLYEVERWINDGKPLQVVPENIPKGTQPKTALQIGLGLELVLSSSTRKEVVVRSAQLT